jgi:NAD(P)-dependent dehydrogenase (short-subunit alcohol dehydrogenase family)
MSNAAPASAADFIRGIEGQRVLVTAGASGIGFAIASTLTALGARVAICDVSDDALASAKQALPGIIACKADVSADADVDAMFAMIARDLGGLDALINNAGIAGPTGGVDEITSADWRRCVDICLTGQFLCARLAVPMLKAAGGGSIVNMSSAAGRHGYAFRTPYSAAKFGVIGFTQSLAKELGPSRIRVNAILPGIVEGPRMDKVISDRARQVGISHAAMQERYLEKVSLRRMVSPYDVAGMVAFLLSDAGANVSGQSLGVDANVETL